MVPGTSGLRGIYMIREVMKGIRIVKCYAWEQAMEAIGSLEHSWPPSQGLFAGQPSSDRQSMVLWIGGLDLTGSCGGRLGRPSLTKEAETQHFTEPPVWAWLCLGTPKPEVGFKGNPQETHTHTI